MFVCKLTCFWQLHHPHGLQAKSTLQIESDRMHIHTSLSNHTPTSSAVHFSGAKRSIRTRLLLVSSPHVFMRECVQVMMTLPLKEIQTRCARMCVIVVCPRDTQSNDGGKYEIGRHTYTCITQMCRAFAPSKNPRKELVRHIYIRIYIYIYFYIYIYISI